MRMPRTANK